MEDRYNYYKNLIQGERFPLAYVDLNLFNCNLVRILAKTKNKKIRIATKSIRSLALIKRILQSDSRFQGVMSFDPREALFLSKNGIDDILLGYPTMQEQAVRDLCGEIKKGKKIIFMVDRVEHVRILRKISILEGCVLDVCLDVDMSTDFGSLHFGVKRSSIKNLKDLSEFMREFQQNKTLKVVGLMGYEAQIAGVGDKTENLFKDLIIRLLKNMSWKKIKEKRMRFLSVLKHFYNQPIRLVNGGGTGSIRLTIEDEAVSEITVGSGFFSPMLFDEYKDFKYEPAAGFALEISRNPIDDVFTCNGGGYVASGSVGKNKLPKPYLPEGAELTRLEGAGEVQTPVSYRGNYVLRVGDPIFFRHAKAGELCERFNELKLIHNGQLIETVKTYRGEGLCFI